MHGQQHGTKMQLVNEAQKTHLDLLQIFNVEKKLVGVYEISNYCR